MLPLEQRLHSYEPLWGSWYLGRRLYSGSGSAVYELSRQRLDKTLRSVVKVIQIRGSEEEMAAQLAKAVDEIERMERLRDCPYIVAYLEDMILPCRDDRGMIISYDVLIRMEYLTCLADDIRDGHAFSEKEVRDLGRQICVALATAHSRDIVHRDIKPGNLYRSEDGRFLLGDFGVSASAGEESLLQTVAGTTAYMSPEVILGNYDRRADFYSLGLVLYQLLNGNFLPFMDENSTYSQREAAIRKRRQGAKIPSPKNGSELLKKALAKAMAFDPEQRFSSANEMRFALEGRRLKKKKAPWLRTLLVLVLCIASGAAGFAAGQYLLPQQLAEPSAQGTDFFVSGIDEEETVVISTYEVILQDLTWEKAKVYCESRGGHLATITSRKEEAEVLALLDEAGLEAAWIGANNLNAANGFQWLTGERFSYAAWGTNEPNNAGEGEYYLMLMNRQSEGWVWNDSHNNGLEVFDRSKVGFVCEWDEAE